MLHDLSAERNTDRDWSAIAPNSHAGRAQNVDSYYPFGELHVDLSQRLPDCTHDSIRARKKRFAKRLEDFTAPKIFISIGENCGPGIKFRDAGLNLLGSQFFDNIVVNSESVIKLLDADFADVSPVRPSRRPMGRASVGL
jgi:hypothetical protein